MADFSSVGVSTFEFFFSALTPCVVDRKDIQTVVPVWAPGNTVVLLRYPKPTPKPRFFAKTVRRRNLGFSAIIDGFWAHLHAKII